MSKKKKSIGAKKRRTVGRSKFDLSTFAGTIAGAIVSKILIKKLPMQSELIKSLIPVAAGAFLSTNKNRMLAGAGLGMMAIGGGALVGTLVPSIGAAAGGVLDGIFDTFSSDPQMGATEEIMYLNGASPGVLDGTAEEMAGVGSDDSYIAGDGNAYMA